MHTGSLIMIPYKNVIAKVLIQRVIVHTPSWNGCQSLAKIPTFIVMEQVYKTNVILLMTTHIKGHKLITAHFNGH